MTSMQSDVLCFLTWWIPLSRSPDTLLRVWAQLPGPGERKPVLVLLEEIPQHTLNQVLWTGSLSEGRVEGLSPPQKLGIHRNINT